MRTTDCPVCSQIKFVPVFLLVSLNIAILGKLIKSVFYIVFLHIITAEFMLQRSLTSSSNGVILGGSKAAL